MLVVRIVLGQNLGVDFKCALDAEHVQVEDFVERTLLIDELDLFNTGKFVVHPDRFSGFVKGLAVAQINLVEEDLVGESDLIDSLVLDALFSVLL